jgi:hypothetical protein
LGVFIAEGPCPFSTEYIHDSLARQALAYLVEGLRFGLTYPDVKAILDQQHKELRS